MDSRDRDEHAPPPHRQPTVRIPTRSADADTTGRVGAGWIITHIEIAGAVVASDYARGPVAAVAVGATAFHDPLLAGDLVSCFATIVKVGSTSITVKVEVFAQRRGHGEGREWIRVTTGEVVYVALDAGGKPRAVPEPSREEVFSNYL